MHVNKYSNTNESPLANISWLATKLVLLLRIYWLHIALVLCIVLFLWIALHPKGDVQFDQLAPPSRHNKPKTS